MHHRIEQSGGPWLYPNLAVGKGRCDSSYGPPLFSCALHFIDIKFTIFAKGIPMNEDQITDRIVEALAETKAYRERTGELGMVYWISLADQIIREFHLDADTFARLVKEAKGQQTNSTEPIMI